MIVVYTLLFIFGLALGSFLNVVSLRYKPGGKIIGKHIRGRSHCLHCKKKLSWKELMPLVSFFAQRGVCIHCRGKLSAQYPLVEFAGGLIVAGVPYFLQQFYDISLFSFTILTPAAWFYIAFIALWILIFFLLLLMTIIDIRHFIIPDMLTVAVGVLGLVFAVFKSVSAEFIVPFHNSFLKNYELIFSPFTHVWMNHALGAFVGGLFFALLFYLGRGRAMGFGDVKLAFALGFALGWPDIGLVIILAFIFGGLWGTVLLFKKKKTLKDRLPFGPFLALGTAITVLFGFQIIKTYFALFSI